MDGRPGPGAGWIPVLYCCRIVHCFIVFCVSTSSDSNGDLEVVGGGWRALGWPMGLRKWMDSSVVLPLKHASYPWLTTLASGRILVVSWRWPVAVGCDLGQRRGLGCRLYILVMAARKGRRGSSEKVRLNRFTRGKLAAGGC